MTDSSNVWPHKITPKKVHIMRFWLHQPAVCGGRGLFLHTVPLDTRSLRQI
eukprot:c34092_g1_i1 orf=2-151(-)